MKKAERTRVITGVEIDGVFVDADLIEQVMEQDRWDSQMGKVLLIHDIDVAGVLVAHGYAVKETRGGYRRGDNIQELYDFYVGREETT